MTVTHTNRKGKTYYLHKSTTKTGKTRYFFSLDEEGDLVEAVPGGYEIYEHPNGQVYLRKTRPALISSEEVAVVEAGMRDYCRLDNFIVDVKKDTIVVYTPDQDVDSLASIFGFVSPRDDAGVRDALQQTMSYSPMLQFVLTDKEQRLFQTQRYSFLGSIDDWIRVGTIDTLPKLVKTYVKHLGEDSYYDLY